jgi:hypothetical protein
MDGELPEEKTRLVKNHITGCATCSAEFESLEKTRTFLHSLDEVDVRTDFDRKFWKKVDDLENRKIPVIFGGWLAGRWRHGLTPLLATLILILGISYVNHSRNNSFKNAMFMDQMDLFADYDVVNNLDVLEQIDREGLPGDLR